MADSPAPLDVDLDILQYLDQWIWRLGKPNGPELSNATELTVASMPALIERGFVELFIDDEGTERVRITLRGAGHLRSQERRRAR